MNRSTDHRSADGPDPELIELPPPRRPFRRLTLGSLSMTVAVAVAMIIGLSSDVRYALRSSGALEIGSLAQWQPRQELQNAWVQAEGEVAPIGGIRFERPLESDSFRLAPIQGNPRLWVQIRVPAGYENEYFVAPTVFSGRLVPLGELGLRYTTLALAPEAAGWNRGHLANDAWLLIDGETPKSTRWLLGLVGLFAAFALFAVGALVSLLRPIRHHPEPTTDPDLAAS